MHLCVIIPSRLWLRTLTLQSSQIPSPRACTCADLHSSFWFAPLYRCWSTCSKPVLVQLLKRRKRWCEIGLSLNQHSLLSLSVIDVNIGTDPSWLTTVNHRLDMLTSLKLLLKNKQMVTWNYLQRLTVCVCVCVTSNQNRTPHTICLC